MRGGDHKARCALTAPLRWDQTQAHLRPGGRGLRPGDAPSVVGPERFTAAGAHSGERAAAYSFGVRASPSDSPAAFQSALPPAVLLPESLRGGCSFGAALLTFWPGRDLSCGRAYGAPCVAPPAGGSQPFCASWPTLFVCSGGQVPTRL